MRDRTRTAVAALAAVVMLAPAAAPQAADEPVLAQLVSEALANSPDLQALEQAVAAARTRPAQARSLADPMLSVGYTNEGWSPSLGSMPDSTLSVMASQELPWPGKRALRGEIASRQADQVAQQLERGRLGVAAGVRRAYHALRAARLLRELTRERAELWAQIEGVARARYSVGQGVQQDVLRTQIEVTRVGQLDAELHAEEAIRVAELNRLLGRPADAVVDVPLDSAGASGPPQSAEPLETALERLRTRSPELAAARAAVEGARLEVELARKDFKPDLRLQAGYMNRGRLDPMWQAGVGISLPLARGRRRAALAEAEARLRAAEQLAQSVELQLRFRTQERLARLEAADRMAALYEQGVVPQDRLSVEAAVASYQSGRVPFVSVLEALGTMYADRGAFVRVLASRGQLRASVEEASLQASPEMAAGSAPLPGPSTSTPGMAAGSSMNEQED